MVHEKSRGWGTTDTEGSEIWDTEPIFLGSGVSIVDHLKLFCYPKKYLLFRYIKKALDEKPGMIRILDVGCGTGAAVIEMKKLFGTRVHVYGIDVVRLQIDLAKEKILQHGIDATLQWYDGQQLVFPDNFFDVVYTSDVLGHVHNVPGWLHELSRVLRPGGRLAMFSESAVGKHAYIRRYLLSRGVNTDPHAEQHISLYQKDELRQILKDAGFSIEQMYSSFWAKFFVHPDEFYEVLQEQTKFPLLRFMNKGLYALKKKTHPVSTALAELYGLVEMVTLGRWIESQGYIILAKRR